MAEYSEVMREAQRMCDYRRKRGLKCNDCDAVHICGLKIRHVGLDTLCAEADAVMSWAAEHPVVYPTWAEWLNKMGIVESRWNGPVLASMRIGVDDTSYIPVVRKMLEPIPADIARNLGIEPKECV